MSPSLKTELEDFVSQQAAEDAFLPEGQRHLQAQIIKQLLGEQIESEPEEVQKLLQKYVGQVAFYRGETPENINSNGVTAEVDLDKIGWLRDQISNDQVIKVAAEHVQNSDISFDFVDLTRMDRVTERALESLERKEDINKLLQKIKSEIIPTLWKDITSGRGRQRPISVGSNRDISQAASAGRNLDTEYAGYKVGINGTNNRAIILVLGRNEDNNPQFALAALYDHVDQDRIWGELMTRGIGSHT